MRRSQISYKLVPDLKKGYTPVVTPGIDAGIELLELGVLTLSSNKQFTGSCQGKGFEGRLEYPVQVG